MRVEGIQKAASGQNMPTLAARLRAKEAVYDKRLPANRWVILRVDGRGFSSLTEQFFAKPFDPAFHALMENAASYLLTSLQGSYAYTGSDEISLVLAPDWTLFDRRVEKLVSLSASAASVAFALGSTMLASFDSRVSVFARLQDVCDYFVWRQMDVERCALQTLCYWTLRHEGASARKAATALHTASRIEQEALLSARSLSFEEPWQRQGIGLSWETYKKMGYNPLLQQEVLAERRRVAFTNELPSGDTYRDWLTQVLEKNHAGNRELDSGTKKSG